MSREFGIYPRDREPLMWVGARAIYKPFDKYGRYLDIPYDRWSSEFNDQTMKEDFIYWIDNFAIPQIVRFAKERCVLKQYFESDNGLFYAEFDDRQSGGYMYIGCGTTEKCEQMIQNKKEN